MQNVSQVAVTDRCVKVSDKTVVRSFAFLTGLHDRKRESARFSLLNLNFFDFNLRFVLKRVSEFSPCVCSGKEYIHRGTEVVC